MDFNEDYQVALRELFQSEEEIPAINEDDEFDIDYVAWLEKIIKDSTEILRELVKEIEEISLIINLNDYNSVVDSSYKKAIKFLGKRKLK